MIREMLPHANEARRQPVSGPAAVARACSAAARTPIPGMTANPALGACADLLVHHGGTAILSETPEIYGAEHLLTRRAVSREVGREAGRADPSGGRSTAGSTAAR